MRDRHVVPAVVTSQEVGILASSNCILPLLLNVIKHLFDEVTSLTAQFTPPEIRQVLLE
jgi:hypothetical protein